MKSNLSNSFSSVIIIIIITINHIYKYLLRENYKSICSPCQLQSISLLEPRHLMPLSFLYKIVEMVKTLKGKHYRLVQSHSLRSLISARPSPVLILTSLEEICDLKTEEQNRVESI